MEAVPRLPMLCFELKSNPQKHAEFGPDLMNLIRFHYQEDPSNYTNEIQSLEKLRQQAMNPTKDVDGCAILKRYFCQLHFLQKRFSTLQYGPTGNDASWKPLIPFMSRKTVDFRLEYIITMYNVGALHTQLGAADDRTTNEGLKFACTHFQCAAWAFKHLETINSMKSRADFDPGFFQFLIPLCLAQAQECIAEKSITDNRKPSISAKVAAQICEYYGQALNALTHGKQEELPIFDVNIKNSHVWINYVKYKKAYYECVSYLFMGMQAEEDEKWGERVAYFEASAEKLKVAVQHAKCVELPQLYKGLDEAMSFTGDVVEGKRKNAVSENDFIYHQEVPLIDNLPKIKGAVLVKCIEFDFSDPEISGPDIFARLISLEVHQLSSVYSEEKAKLLRSVSSAVEEKDVELVSFMQSLKLDFLHPHEDLNSLPEELVERCAACEAKPTLIQDLNEAMDKLTQDQYQVDSLMKDVIKLIADEEKADADYHRIMGTAPQPSIVVTELKCEANRYAEALKKATDSNESLRNAISAHVNNLHILTLPLEELEQHLPRVLTELAPEEEAIVRELRRLVDKVEEMKNQRAQLMMKFRESLKDDDITQKLVLKNDKFTKMVGQEISKHRSVKNVIEQNLTAQTNILNALTNAYAAYAPIRKATYEIMQQRSAQINALIESFDVSDDVLKKASKGLEFYSKLEGNVRKLLSRLKGTCKVQEDNRMQMYDKTKKPVRTPSLSDAPSSTPKLKDYIGYNKQYVKQDSNEMPLPYNPYYGLSAGSATIPRSDVAANVYPSAAPNMNVAASNQYYATITRPPPVGSEASALNKTTTEPPTDTKNQIASSLPTTNYGSTYPSSYAGYSYSQPATSYQPQTTFASVNQPSTASTYSQNTSNTAAYQPSVNYGAGNVAQSYGGAAQYNVTATYQPTNYPNQWYQTNAASNYQQPYTTGAVPQNTTNTPQSSTQQPAPVVPAQQNTALPANNTQPQWYGNYSNATPANSATNNLPASNAAAIVNYGSSAVNQTPYVAGARDNYNMTSAYANAATLAYNTGTQNTYNPSSYAYPNVNYDSYAQSLNNTVQNTQNHYNNYSIQSTPNSADTQNKPDFNYVSVDASTYNTSHYYTSAGQNCTTNIESTSKTLDGRSYVVQYNTASHDNVDTANGAIVNDQNGLQYYNNQYGYQYNDPKLCQDTTQKFVPKIDDEGQRLQANRNSMTYMQASSNKGGGVSTYSVNGSASSSEKKPESNVDLLADLDFDVSHTPLVALPESTDNQMAEKMQNLNVNINNTSN
ncbi:tyrosine-protein phosphatase non-receptor type 23-like [Planococcus citri]|uniref:tyrosine-protein phosphatase non-receptor type 23-like n=1 Tax=Planococcus citri TaxID=170843 RepID=UPI0031F9B71F